jgi:hypothetical protein
LLLAGRADGMPESFGDGHCRSFVAARVAPSICFLMRITGQAGDLSGKRDLSGKAYAGPEGAR